MTDSRRLVAWMHSDRYPTWSMPESTVDALSRALGPGWRVVSVPEPTFAGGDGSREIPGPVLAALAEAEIYFGFGIARELFLGAPELRWVHSAAAGARASLFPEMSESEVIFTNSAGIYAEPLAEWAIAAILHFSRGLDVAGRGKRERRWPYDDMAATGHPQTEVSGSTVGIVGYGGIGKAIGRRARALGMRVLAVRSRADASLPDGADEVFGPADLDTVLERSDHLVLSLPETASTTGLIGASELARMRSGSVLLNLSRGGIVDEDALAEALGSHRIRGAALDVFREEPLPADSPLWTLDNVLITPHAGAISPRFWERQTELMVRNIGHYLSGGRMENVVDKMRGY
ncbi:MAG: D-2-hydroxyacid dehydrogenase [marine benthic group bacterium]|nr:D-2-hydroxyacid dehydrogenase [Candidatus Benthicola marisminoris]